MKYILETFGDLPIIKKAFASLSDALEFIKCNFTSIDKCTDDSSLEIFNGPDAEDDRILVYEIQNDGVLKVIWHFSGWHWDADEFNLPQGKLLNDSLSLYDRVMQDC